MVSPRNFAAWHPGQIGASRRSVGVLACVSYSLLIAIGALLTVRRLSGAFTTELSAPTLLSIAVGLVGVIFAVRLSWRALRPLTDDDHHVTWADEVVGWGGSTVILLWGLGCSYPFSRFVDGFLWIPLIIAEQFWRQNFFDAGRPEYQIDPSRAPSSVIPSGEHAADGGENAAEVLEEPCLQQQFRVRESDGSESIYATLRAEFQTDQRHATLHVGFCPPLEYLPQIEAAPCDGPPCQVKVVQAFAHGVRLDLKLDTPAEEPFQLAVDLAARRPGGAEPSV